MVPKDIRSGDIPVTKNGAPVIRNSPIEFKSADDVYTIDIRPKDLTPEEQSPNELPEETFVESVILNAPSVPSTIQIVIVPANPLDEVNLYTYQIFMYFSPWEYNRILTAAEKTTYIF